VVTGMVRVQGHSVETFRIHLTSYTRRGLTSDGESGWLSHRVGLGTLSEGGGRWADLSFT
jgi:hypothetical protein